MNKQIICKYCHKPIIKPYVYLIEVYWLSSGKKYRRYYHTSCYKRDVYGDWMNQEDFKEIEKIIAEVGLLMIVVFAIAIGLVIKWS